MIFPILNTMPEGLDTFLLWIIGLGLIIPFIVRKKKSPSKKLVKVEHFTEEEKKRQDIGKDVIAFIGGLALVIFLLQFAGCTQAPEIIAPGETDDIDELIGASGFIPNFWGYPIGDCKLVSYDKIYMIVAGSPLAQDVYDICESNGINFSAISSDTIPEGTRVTFEVRVNTDMAYVIGGSWPLAGENPDGDKWRDTIPAAQGLFLYTRTFTIE